MSHPHFCHMSEIQFKKKAPFCSHPHSPSSPTCHTSHSSYVPPECFHEGFCLSPTHTPRLPPHVTLPILSMYHANVFTRCFLSLPLTLPVFPHMSHFPFVLHTPPRHFPFGPGGVSRARRLLPAHLPLPHVDRPHSNTSPPPGRGHHSGGGQKRPSSPRGGHSSAAVAQH